MKIHHIGIWTNELENLRDFYVKYFNMHCGEKYLNQTRGFSSYFLSFKNGTKLEIMNLADLRDQNKESNIVGLAHIAISVGSVSEVDRLTETLRLNGFTIVGDPRTTGDGFYESVILDPDGNHIEITE